MLVLVVNGRQTKKKKIRKYCDSHSCCHALGCADMQYIHSHIYLLSFTSICILFSFYLDQTLEKV